MIPAPADSPDDETSRLAVIIGAYLLLLHHGGMGPFGKIRVVERANGEIVWEPAEE